MIRAMALTTAALALVRAAARVAPLEGRVAAVTGGSKGLGRAITEELIAQGCTVVACARDASPEAWEPMSEDERGWETTDGEVTEDEDEGT